jgi:hypothetical protein
VGILLIPKAQGVGGRSYAVGWKNGERVTIPAPNPAWSGYGAAQDRFSNWRGAISPLGGAAEWPWSQQPKFGEAALKAEFRRRK